MNRGQQSIAASTALTALALVFVVLRCIARFVYGKNSGAEDYLVIAALGLSSLYTAMVIIQYLHGLGTHFVTVAPSDFSIMVKAFYASILFYNLGLTFTKLSILVQYLRIFDNRSFRRACYCLMALIAAYGCSVVLVSIFACSPVSFFWDKSIEDGKCINLTAFWFCNASFNIVTDLTIFTLPVPMLKELHLPRRQKWTLLLVFTIGGFGCVTSVLRLHSLYIISISKDITWDNPAPATWSAAEVNVGIVCACLPTIRPIVNKLFPRLLQTNQPKAPILIKGLSGIGDITHATDVTFTKAEGKSQDSAFDSQLSEKNGFSARAALMDISSYGSHGSGGEASNNSEPWVSNKKPYSVEISAGS